MSVNRIYAPGASVSADPALGGQVPVHVVDGAVAAELLRQRIGGAGTRAVGRSPPYAAPAEGMHRLKLVMPSPHREVLASLVARAYSQLLDEDAHAARRTLEDALTISQTLHPDGRNAVPRALVATQSSRMAGISGAETDRVKAVNPAPGARVVVRTLGTFEVLVDGVAIPDRKKQPRRTLALLKAIIALGGRDVCRAALADALWPEFEGDKAQNALTVTLHRLRAYLGVAGAVPIRHGRLSLEQHHVWVDSLAFEAAVRAVSPVIGCDSVERVFALYRGPFLAADSDEPWTVRLRERLRSRFVSVLTGAAAALEAHDRSAEAAALYERGLAADDLVGAFHDGLIRCLCQLGRLSEAESARRRKLKLAPAGLG